MLRPAPPIARARVIRLSAGGLLIFLLVAGPEPASGAQRVWDGGGADNNASSPTNWAGDIAPSQGDDIVLDASSTKDMTWDDASPSNIASWTQLSGYSGTVSFETKQPGHGSPTNIMVTGDCVVSNGTWTHPANTGTDENRLSFTIQGNLTIGPNGAINVSSNGLSASGLGRGLNEGAGHGGQGGLGNNKQGGPTYGSIRAPTHSGSGGNHGRGGGAVRLAVLGTTTIDGDVEAHGFDLAGSWQYTGSGGSVLLATASLSGSGRISVRGGHGKNVGAGGGGRIAVILTASDSFGSVNLSAIGGDNNPDSRSGAPGTIYLETQTDAPGKGTLLITNNVSVTRFTDISPNVTDTSVGTLLIGTHGPFQVNTGQTFTVSGVWSNGHSFTPRAGSRVILTDSNVTTSVYGNSTFAELVVQSPGKTVRFQPGTTNGVLEKLTLVGAPGTNLALRSISDGSQWGLDITGAVIQSILYVDVKDSDAGAGAAAVALDSLDSGNNQNWIFGTPGQTDTWTGASNSQWGVPANWNLARAPIAADMKTVISAVGSNFPTLPSAQDLNQIEVQAGASLFLGGYDLAVRTLLDVDGILAAAGTETITVHGNVDFSFGTFSNANSYFVLTSSNAQTVTSHGESFYHLAATNQHGGVTFADTVVARFFDNYGADVTFSGGINAWRAWSVVSGGPVTQSFGAASSSVITNLYILGDSGVPIVLKSSSPGSQWGLNAVRFAHVIHANVTDSDANAGVTVYPISSVNGGNNNNWDFGAAWATWNGATSSDFGSSSNWTPAAVPGAANRVLLDGNAANSLTLSATTTLRELVVGPTRSSVMTVTAPLTVIEDIRVHDYGSLAVDRPSVVGDNIVITDGGVVTHSANGSTILNRLQLSIGADLDVDQGGRIDADIKGYASSLGPGRPSVGNAAASHAGEGGSNNPGNDGPIYGSITAPTHAGSGATGNGPGNGAGGGVIRLDVQGATTVNGDITANGGDGVSWTYQGSGGSVYLTTGTLRGNGSIEAHGGNIPSQGGSGGGGRVAVVVSGGGYGNVSMSARAGASSAGIWRGAPGTVHRRAQGKWEVIVESDAASTVYTRIPSETNAVDGELRNATLIASNVGARVRLTDDTIVSDLFVYSNAFLTLDTFTLTVRTPEHHLDSGERGPGNTNAVDNYAQIIWLGKGSVLMFR